MTTSVLVLEGEPAARLAASRCLERAGVRARIVPFGEIANVATLRFGGLEIDALGRRVTRDGEDVRLTEREYALLLHFARHPGRAFSRDELIEAVWRYSFYSDTSTVTVHVRRLRAKIEDDPARPRRLRTVRGVGYRFDP